MFYSTTLYTGIGEKMKDNLKSKISSLKDSEAREDIGKNISSGITSFLAPAMRESYEIYDFREEPEDDRILLTTAEDIPYRYVPKVLKNWECEYFHTPYGKARLFRHMVYAALFILVLMFTSLSIKNPYTYVSIGLFFILFLNFSFRYYGIALYNKPMPEIPFFSKMGRETESYEFSIFAKQMYNAVGMDIELPFPHNEEKEEETKTNSIPIINRVNNANKSPGTVLSEYLRENVEWDYIDVEEKTDGIIDKMKLDLLLDDNEIAWKDYEILGALEKAMKAKPERWLEQMKLWKGEK